MIVTEGDRKHKDQLLHAKRSMTTLKDQILEIGKSMSVNVITETILANTLTLWKNVISSKG